MCYLFFFFFFQAEDGIRDLYVTGVQTCALPISAHGLIGLRALAWPARDILLEIEPGSVWGIVVSTIARRPPLTRTLGARGTAPGGTGPATVRATGEFERLVELLLDAAPREMLIRRLGEALSQTSRQVNTLERRVAPTLRLQVASV